MFPLKLLPALVLAATPALAADKTLVTVMTAAEPQVQMMSLVLTLQAARQGAAAHILLCGPGGDLALKDGPAAIPQKPMNATPQQMMQQLMQAGVKVDVCAIYLPNKERGAEALIEGVGIARPETMAAELLAASQVLSF